MASPIITGLHIKLTIWFTVFTSMLLFLIAIISFFCLSRKKSPVFREPGFCLHVITFPGGKHILYLFFKITCKVRIFHPFFTDFYLWLPHGIFTSRSTWNIASLTTLFNASSVFMCALFPCGRTAFSRESPFPIHLI